MKTTRIAVYFEEVEVGPAFPLSDDPGPDISVTSDCYLYIKDYTLRTLPRAGDRIFLEIQGQKYPVVVYPGALESVSVVPGADTSMSSGPTIKVQIDWPKYKGKRPVGTVKEMKRWLLSDGFVLYKHLRVSDKEKGDERYKKTFAVVEAEEGRGPRPNRELSFEWS
mgnify:CR=1 FL=1